MDDRQAYSFGDSIALSQYQRDEDLLPFDQRPLWLRGEQVAPLAEIILPFVTPQNNTRLAFLLIDKFGSLPQVLAAPVGRMTEVHGIEIDCAEHLSSIYEVAKGLASFRMTPSKPSLGSMNQVLEYCHVALAFEQVERLKVLFMDSQKRLIADETLQTGTVTHVPVYVREVLRRTIELQASSIILVHNHPSGVSAPSPSDIDTTRRLVAAGKFVQVELLDHLIIGRFGSTSLREWCRASVDDADLFDD